MEYRVDEVFANGEWVTGILRNNQPVASILPGLCDREKREIEEKFHGWVGTEDYDACFAFDCVKDEIEGIDSAEIQYEIDNVIDILNDVKRIVKSKRAKELLRNAIDRLEDDVRRMLEDVDTCTELACEKINKFLEKQ